MTESAETIARTFELLDSETYEQALPLFDEEFEMETTSDLASEPDVYRGPEGVRRWWESFLEVMDWVQLEVEDVHPVDPERVLVEFRIRTRGRASGIETSQRAVGLGTTRAGKVMRLQFFNDLERARAAAGLPPH